MWIVKKRIDGVKLWTRFSSKKVTKKKIIKKYKMRGGNIATIRTNTEAFCNGIGLDWFLNDNETLLTGGKHGIGNLVKSDEKMTEFTQSACILSSSDQSFTTLLETIRNNARYTPHLGGVTDIGQMVQRLIYNRPLAFVGNGNITSGMETPGNPKALDHIAGSFEPYVTGKSLEKYELISLAALVGCWSLTPIVHSGKKFSAHNIGRLREDKFFNGDKKNGDFNTEAYVCGLVGARFEKANQMEHAYIKEGLPKNNPIHKGLRELFESKITLNKNKYKHTYGGNQTAINKQNLYRERIRFTFELFLLQCFNISTTKNQSLCPVFTGLGAGVWAANSGIGSNINDIIEDVILSILTDNPDYLETFPAIRISSINEYPDIVGHLGSISTVFNDKYKHKYGTVFGSECSIYHTHFNKGSGQSFFTQQELNQLIGTENVKQAFLFAWDGNSFVGNEYWYGDMKGSGDPVTVSSCCIGQLCNPFINHNMLDRIEPLPTQNINVSNGNTTGSYAIKVGETDFPVRTAALGKKRFIEKVVIEVNKNKTPREFICSKDENNRNWGDKIVWNGTNYIYHDENRQSEGIVKIMKNPNGLTGAAAPMGVAAGPMGAAAPMGVAAGPKNINVRNGNTSGIYAIKVGSKEYPVYNTSLGKKRFIEKVVKEVNKNRTPREFICPKDENNRNWGDKIVWNGTEYKYFDTTYGSQGIVKIIQNPNGLTGNPVSPGPMGAAAVAMPTGQKSFNLRSGNVTENYFIDVQDKGRFPCTRIGKKRFINKVIKDIRSNGPKKTYYPRHDPEHLIYGDKIEYDGNKLTYHDGTFSSEGVIVDSSGSIIHP